MFPKQHVSPAGSSSLLLAYLQMWSHILTKNDIFVIFCLRFFQHFYLINHCQRKQEKAQSTKTCPKAGCIPFGEADRNARKLYQLPCLTIVREDSARRSNCKRQSQSHIVCAFHACKMQPAMLSGRKERV